MKRSVISGLLVLLLTMIVSTAYARVLVKPAVSIREEYNDNIFLTEKDKEDDYITTVSPSIDLEYYPNSKLDLTLNYALNFKFYGEHSEYNDTDLGETQSIQFTANARPYSRVFIDVTDTYDRVAIDQRIKNSEDNAFFNKTDINIFTISPYVLLPITPSTSLNAGYEYINIWYDESVANDSDSHSLFGILDKRVNPKLTGFLSYRFTRFDTDRSDSLSGVAGHNKHNGTVGISYKMNSNIELRGEIGHSSLHSQRLTDSDSVVWEVSGAYNQSDDGALSAIVTYGRSFINSTTNGASKSDSADLLVTYGRVYEININPYYRFDDFVNVEREDKVAGIRVTLSKELSQRTSVSINGEYEQQEYLPEDESITRLAAGTNINYKIIKNLTLSLGYRYRNRDSDQIDDDYKNNIAWVQGKYDF